MPTNTPSETPQVNKKLAITQEIENQIIELDIKIKTEVTTLKYYQNERI